MRNILFITKKRHVYDDTGGEYTAFNSGLYNSAKFVSDMLCTIPGLNSNIVDVVDNNDIDRVVTAYKPNIVIIEALWVVPEKFAILQNLHPKVKWVVRLHSELPFLANEGTAMTWLKAYEKYRNVFIASNSNYLVCAMKHILKKPVLYTPNYYPTSVQRAYPALYKTDNVVEVGCFGAIRPMKNHLTQAVAAIKFAENNDKALIFHVNNTRLEQKGDNNYKNLKALFEGTPHTLKEHPWMRHSDFLKQVRLMDIGLQVSLSETYNIVAADFVNNNIPIVTSKEISFVNHFNKVRSNKDIDAIVYRMQGALDLSGLFTRWNKLKLRINSAKSRIQWETLLNDQ